MLDEPALGSGQSPSMCLWAYSNNIGSQMVADGNGMIWCLGVESLGSESRSVGEEEWGKRGEYCDTQRAFCIST